MYEKNQTWKTKPDYNDTSYTKLAQKMNDKKVMNTQLLFIDNIENVNPASILCWKE